MYMIYSYCAIQFHQYEIQAICFETWNIVWGFEYKSYRSEFVLDIILFSFYILLIWTCYIYFFISIWMR